MAANLMEHAVQMERHAEQLATGLAQAGAPKETIQVVTQCASVGRALVTALGNKNQNPPEANESPEGDHPPEDQMEPETDGQPPEERQRKGDLGDASRNMAAEYNRKRKREE